MGASTERGTLVSEAVAAAVAQAQEHVQQQPVVHCDETSFAQGNQDGRNPEQRQGWLWVLVSPLVSVFVVALSRSQATAQQLLSAAFGKVLVSDRHRSYTWVDPEQRQVCWAHLLRDFQAMAFRRWPNALEFPRKFAQPYCVGATDCSTSGESSAGGGSPSVSDWRTRRASGARWHALT